MAQMFILDLLDSMPQVRLSGEVMKLILWALKELGVPDVPSFHQLRDTQTALVQQIKVNPCRHESAMGNIFYQNSLEDLLALVSSAPAFCGSMSLDFTAYRTGLIHWSENT